MYPLMYLCRIPSKFLGTNLPLTTNRCRHPLVPISASKNVMTCSGCLCILKCYNYTQYGIIGNNIFLFNSLSKTRLTKKKKNVISIWFLCVKRNLKSNVCLLQQQASKQDVSIQSQGKQQVSASHRVLKHQGASCAAPPKNETLHLDAGHNASEDQRKNRDAILKNDQIIHSIQEMYPSGMNYTCHS